MRPTLLQYAAAWLPAVPAVVALLVRARINRARFWIAIWCALLFARNVGMWLLGSRGVNNLWLIYLLQPVLAATALWAFSYWQTDRLTWRVFRYLAPVVAIVNVALALAIEDYRTFSVVASPFYFVTLLLAALFTFIRLGLTTEDPLVRQDWFWISAGVMVGAATATAIGPLAWYFLDPRVDLLHAMLNVGAAADVIMIAAITRGMLCAKQQTYSGGFSSLRFSRSFYSSQASP